MANHKLQPTPNIAEHGDTYDQLEGWRIDGLRTGAQSRNVDQDGKLYVSLTHSGGTRTVKVWKDSAKADADLVLEGALAGDGQVPLAEKNASGMDGSVTVTANSDLTDDTDIELWCFYALDEDLHLYEKTLDQWLATFEQDSWAKQLAQAKQDVENDLRQERDDLPTISGDDILLNSVSYRFDYYYEFYQSVAWPDWGLLLDARQLKRAACYRALFLIHWFMKNKAGEEADQWAQTALWYKEEYEKEIKNVQVDWDLNDDGKIDRTSRGTTLRLERA